MKDLNALETLKGKILKIGTHTLADLTKRLVKSYSKEEVVIK